MQPWFTLVCALCQTPLAPSSSAATVSPLTLPSSPAVVQMTTPWRARAPAAPGASDPSVGEDFHLSHGRSLRVSLTPTPIHCAPLVELTF